MTLLQKAFTQSVNHEINGIIPLITDAIEEYVDKQIEKYDPDIYLPERDRNMRLSIPIDQQLSGSAWHELILWGIRNDLKIVRDGLLTIKCSVLNRTPKT